MEPETHQNPPYFSIKTPFSGEKELMNLHGECLQDDIEIP